MSLWCICRKPHTYLAPTKTFSPDGAQWDSTWSMSPRSSIGCLQNDFQPYGTFDTICATILRQDYNYLQTDWNELPLEPRHLGVPSSVSKMISKPMIRLAQTMHVSCTDTYTVSKQTETRFHSPRSSNGCVQNNSEPMVRSVQTIHVSSIKISTISNQTETSYDLSLVT
jgi:hypothetical protein